MNQLARVSLSDKAHRLVKKTPDPFIPTRTKLENVIHRIFDPVKLDVEIKDRFGNPVVPLFVIDEAVNRIKDGTITGYQYDPGTASLKRSVG